MTFFQQLEQETTEQRTTFADNRLIKQALKGQLSQASYLVYLAQAYHHVKHTVPLLMACGAKIPHSKEFARQAMAEYIEEEYGHEQWILNDIKNAGGDPNKVKKSKPHIETELMVSYMYDYIERINPLGFLGMVYVLEGTSIKVATQAANKLMDSLNLGKDSFSYLLSHGSLDIKHMSFFKKLVNQITTPEDQASVVHVAQVEFKLFGDVLSSI